MMDDRFSQQLKKGVLEMLVLELVRDHPTYGYELLTTLRERSGGVFALREGTLYPILYRLEDDGLIASEWSQGQGRTAPKKIYRVTQAGAAESVRRIAQWRALRDTVDKICQGGNEQ